MIDDILRRNKEWSENVSRRSPDFFPRLAAQQAPHYFWIGCSDSRVPANVVAGLDPGEVFVHRNVANVVHSGDLNLLSTLEFAVNVLKVKEIMVTGHYNCGGVRAAMGEVVNGLAQHWIAPIRRLAKERKAELDALADEDARIDRLCEINVLESVRRVAETPVMQEAWRRGERINVHGLVYGLKDGRLRDLGCTITPDDMR